MDRESRNFPAFVERDTATIRLESRELGLVAQRQLRDRRPWKNGQPLPSKLAKAQLKAFCKKMIERDKLTLPAYMIDFADLGQDQD